MNGSEWTDILNTWSMTRASGLSAFFMLGNSVICGMLSSWKFLNPKTRGTFQLFHQWMGWFGWLFVIMHLIALWQDNYVEYTWSEILIPFSSDELRVENGFGSLALYCLMALLLSSDFFRRKFQKTWKILHLLAFPAFILMLMHGIATGTDTKEVGTFILYLTYTVLLLMLAFVRAMLKPHTT